MTHREIMSWGRRWHYPFLRIGDEASPPTPDVLKQVAKRTAGPARRQRLPGAKVEK